MLPKGANGIPFNQEEWISFDNFVFNFPWEDGRRPTRDDFISSLMGDLYGALAIGNPAHAFMDVVKKLRIRYPKYAQVKATGLVSEEGMILNGTVGTVIGKYARGRVSVEFPNPFGMKHVKPCNLAAGQKPHYFIIEGENGINPLRLCKIEICNMTMCDA